MPSLLVAVADIECPNCSKLALLEGQPVATFATSDFLLLTKPHCNENRCGLLPLQSVVLPRPRLWRWRQQHERLHPVRAGVAAGDADGRKPQQPAGKTKTGIFPFFWA